MKKIILLAALFIVMTANAQKGAQSAGAQLSYGSEIENLGVGVHYTYNITDQITLAPSFNYFLEKDKVNMWDLNFDAHYNFALKENIVAYPLAGLTYTVFDNDFTDSSDGYFGINLGGGIAYDISETIVLGAELKYQIRTGDGENEVFFAVKASYKF